MNRLGHLALIAMFWLLVGALLLSEGKSPFLVVIALALMTAPCFAESWIRARHRARGARRGAGTDTDGVPRPLLRDIGIAALVALTSFGLALWTLLGF